MFLTVNPGSSSIKYALFDSEENSLLHAKIARIHEGDVKHCFTPVGGGKEVTSISSQHMEDWVEVMDRRIQAYAEANNISDDFITIVRVAHDGGKFAGPTLVDNTSLGILESIKDMAPLHVPVALTALRKLQQVYAGDIWMVFDTHFHKDMPWQAQRTGMPARYDQDLNMRRYGFHGLSHQYAANRITEIDPDARIICCHLGSGSSITAIEHGKSVATSMGFGPGTGLVMGTRAGDVDWEAVLYAMEHKGLGTGNIRTLLYKNAGMKEITGKTDLMPEILEHIDESEYHAAFDVFVYSIIKTIGSFIPLFDGPVTHIVFTGGMGSGSYEVRESIIEKFKYIGWEIDREQNKALGSVNGIEVIGAENSKVSVIVLETDEELMLVKEVVRVL